MGLRFRKSITIFPGVKLNISKSGLSVSVGKKGVHASAGTSGRKSVSVGVPGTGLSYTKTISGGSKKKALGIGFTVVVITIAVIMGIIKYKDRIGAAFSALTGQKTAVETTVDTDPAVSGTLVINPSTKKIHLPSCRYATGDKVKTTDKTKDQLIKEGYEACKTCKP